MAHPRDAISQRLVIVAPASGDGLYVTHQRVSHSTTVIVPGLNAQGERTTVFGGIHHT